MRTDSAVHDFDLHGLVGIRLVDPDPSDVAAVRRQIGPIEAPLVREPDLVVRFVERRVDAGPLHLVGDREAGFDADAFVVLRGKHKTRVAMELPFDHIGGPLELRCERGVLAVPHLLALVNLAVAARGGVALHASGFRYRDAGVLVTGWAKGGKTELLLGFAAEGAAYIGDEWIYLDREGDRMSGVPEPVRVWDRDLRQLPSIRRRLPRAQRTRLATLGHATRLASRMAGGNGHAPAGGWRLQSHRLGTVLEAQRNVRVPPARLFGASTSGQSPLHHVLFVSSHDAPEVVVERVSSDEVAERMAVSLQEERADLLACYRRFRFAFPERRSRLLDSIERLERARLHRFLRGRACHRVLHPYPPSIPALVEAVRPVLEERSA